MHQIDEQEDNFYQHSCSTRFMQLTDSVPSLPQTTVKSRFIVSLIHGRELTWNDLDNKQSDSPFTTYNRI